MALNPLTFTEKVGGDFLKYQLTAYPLTDPTLNRADEGSLVPLGDPPDAASEGPYTASRGRSEREAPSRNSCRKVPSIPSWRTSSAILTSTDIRRAIRSIVSGKTTLVSTGTGSGKTESFSLPRDQPLSPQFSDPCSTQSDRVSSQCRNRHQPGCLSHRRAHRTKAGFSYLGLFSKSRNRAHDSEKNSV